MRLIKTLTLALLATLMSGGITAQEKATTDYRPNIHGTIRGKYEYQTEEGKGRFQVRNARISVDGNITPIISYKAEIDLCDEGSIKMLDAPTARSSPSRWATCATWVRLWATTSM